MKPKLFNLRLLAFLWNFKYLLISEKAKWLNSKKKKKYPWRRIEILSEKELALHKKFWSIYCEVLSVTLANFTVVKYNSKISIIYHQTKFQNIIMNRSSIKKAELKHFAIFTEKHLRWSLFLNKNAGLQSWNFIKKRLI